MQRSWKNHRKTMLSAISQQSMEGGLAQGREGPGAQEARLPTLMVFPLLQPTGGLHW